MQTSPDTFPCPDCGARLRRSDDLREGERVQCPRCELRFPVPEEERFSPSPDAGRRADALDDYDFPARRRIDRPDDEDYPRGVRGRVEDLSPDYEVRPARWLRLAKQHYPAFFGPCLGYALVAQGIQFAVQMVVGGIGVAVIGPPLQAGFLIVALRQLKATAWEFKDFFGGFKFFGQAIGVQLLGGLAVQLAMVPGVVVGVIGLFIDANGRLTGQPGTWWGSYVILGVSVAAAFLVGTYLATRLLFFSMYLVLDRGFNVLDALKGSWVLTRGHFWGLLWFELILAAINLTPAALLAAAVVPTFYAVQGPPAAQMVGLHVLLWVTGSFMLVGLTTLFTLPFTVLAQTAAYLDVAGSEPPAEPPADATEILDDH